MYLDIEISSPSKLVEVSHGTMEPTKYAAVVFADLERHSAAWTQIRREKMVSLIAEYRYLAESLASQYGSFHVEWAGDGHMFLFESADAATRFGLHLIEEWGGSLALRLGCHFGECTPMSGEGWIGRCNAIAKRVEAEAEPNSLFVTESVLDLLDLPVYEFEEAGAHALKGDHLPRRVLYRINALDRKALDSKPREELSAEDWFLKGVALIGTEREWSDEEADCYREALRIRPDYPEAHNNLAVMLRARGDEQAAAGHYQEALRLRPDYPEAHSNYAAMLAGRGMRGSEEHYREALRLRPDYVDAHHGLAGVLHAHRELDEAVDHYREALRLRPEHPEAHSNFAALLEDTGQAREAERHYREALRIRPAFAEGHYNFALFLEGRGDAAGAEHHYREAIRLRPEYGEARNNLAILLQRRGELDEAAVHYREALRLRPDDPETHYNFALLLRKTGDEEGAEQHLRTARELAP
jgi:tetratricopeptide (TPR) repeat protein